MFESRHEFHENLKELESATLQGLELVLAALDRSLQSLADHDIALAGLVLAQDAAIDRRYLEVHDGVLTLLARQAPVAGELRLVAALLHIIQCVERMGDQCANIAKLVPLAGGHAPADTQTLGMIERMGQLAHEAVARASGALRTHDLAIAQDLIEQDSGIGALNRELVNRAVEIGDDLDVREWAMFMILVARALERIAENAASIAEQTVFVVTGSFPESKTDGR